MAAEWREIPGYEGRYLVSDDGRVASINYRGMDETRQLAVSLSSGGYLRVSLYDDNLRRRSIGLHVLVASAFIGPRPAGLDVNHKDGVKTNNARTNLEYCTRSQNVAHAHSIGLSSNKGERNPRCKLSAAAVAEIRHRALAGADRKSLALEFGVSGVRISQIKHGAAIAWESTV